MNSQRREKRKTGMFAVSSWGFFFFNAMNLETIFWRFSDIWQRVRHGGEHFQREKADTGRKKAPCLRPPRGSWDRSQSPIRRSQSPLKFQDQNRQNTKEKPTEERKCFPTKAISSNLYFSNKFVSSFRCHYSKMTCCLLTIIEPLLFFSDLLVNIYQ